MKVIGIHVEGGNIYVSMVSRRRKSFFVSVNKKQKTLPESTQEAFQNLVKILNREFYQKKITTVTGLDVGAVLIKNIEIPLKSGAAVYKTLPFQLESQIPYSLEEATILTISRRKDNLTAVKFFSTHQPHVQEHLVKMQQFGIDPDHVGCHSQALYRYMESFYPFDKGCIFHLSDEKIRIVVVSEAELVVAYEINRGIKPLINALSLDLLHHTESQLKALLFEVNLFEKSKEMYPHLYECLNQIFKEIDRTLFCSSTKHKLILSFSILSLGETALLTDLLTSFSKCYKDYSFHFVNQDGTLTHEHFEIPIGLALDVLKQDALSLQFRQGNFVSPQSIKKAVKKVLFTASFALLLTLFGYVTVIKMLNTKEKRLICQIDQFIQQNQDQIPNYQDKISRLDSSLISKIKFIRRSFGKKQKTSGYFATPPRVGDHVQQITHCLGLFPQINVKQLDFDLTQCPTFENPEISYEFQLLLWLYSGAEEDVRLFCEELLKSESLSKNGYELLKTEIPDEYKVNFFVTNKS